MRLRRFPAVVAVAAALLGVPAAQAADYPDPGYVTGDITAVHDPSMIRAADGSYLLYSTDQYLQIRRSTDRIHFTKIGSVFPGGAPWTAPFTDPANPGYLWAPDISFHNGKYYLYYAASTLGSRNSAIFLATSPTALPAA